MFSPSKNSKIFNLHLILAPTVGFLLVKRKQRRLEELKKLPLRFTADNTYIFSFGDDVLPIVATEAYKKNIVLFALVDTNQKKTITGIDYPIFSTDDSVSIAYFFSIFFFNLFLIF